MNFNDLMARMRELDQPTVEAQILDTPATEITPVAEEPNEGNEFTGALEKAKAAGQKEFEVDGKKYQVKEDGTVEECPMNPTMDMDKPDTPPPSMSVNLNAQGLDDIAELMKLMTKVNPDMINQPEKPTAITPLALPSNDRPELPPLKMLPDLDAEQGPEDNKDDSKEKEEAFGNSLNDSEPEVKDVDYMNNKLAGGMNRPKATFPKVAGADNPMQRSRIDTRESIRAELLQRLAEAKGAK